MRPKKVIVDVSITLHKQMEVFVDDYNTEIKDINGDTSIWANHNYDNCDLKEAVLNHISNDFSIFTIHDIEDLCVDII